MKLFESFPFSALTKSSTKAREEREARERAFDEHVAKHGEITDAFITFKDHQTAKVRSAECTICATPNGLLCEISAETLVEEVGVAGAKKLEEYEQHFFPWGDPAIVHIGYPYRLGIKK